MSMKKLEPPEGWQDLINQYLETLQASGLSHETVETRRRKLSHLARLLNCPPLEVTKNSLIHTFATQTWNSETLRAYVTTARGFWTFLEDNNITHDIAQYIPYVHVARGVPHPVPERVLIAAYKKASHEELLMLRLGAECGLRRNEIAQVHTHDVIDDLIGKSLIVHGKGSKDRIVPLPSDLAEIIINAQGFLFPGRFTGHVEASYIGKRVSRLLGKGYSCHSLRHRFATRTYESTHDILLVSKLLGHESVNTTQVYIALPYEDMRRAVDSVLLRA